MRKTNFVRRFACMAASLSWAYISASAARAQEARPAPPPATQSLNEALNNALQEERWQDAQSLLAQYPPDVRHSSAMLIIEALVLRHTDQPRRAIDLYNRAIAQSDDPAAVRAALGFTLLDIQELRAAETQFRLALAGHLPPQTKALVLAALGQVQEERRWIFSASASVAPDSNVNQATNATRVEIFGLPFELSDEAQRKSGINTVGTLGVDRILHLSPNVRFRLSSYGRYSNNKGSQFDDATLGFAAGPDWRVGANRLSLRATSETRWFAGDHYSDTFGGRLDWSRDLGANTVLDVGVLAQHYDEVLTDFRDGPVLGLDLARTRYLSPDSFWRLTVSARHSDAEAGSESYWLARIAPAYYTTLPFGAALFVEPSLLTRRNDETSFGFASAREDTQAGISARLFKTDWSALGFSPYLGAEYSKNGSNIALYSFDRTRYEFGVSRSF